MWSLPSRTRVPRGSLGARWVNAGHRVLVVTSSAVPAYVQSRVHTKPVPGTETDGPVEIRRLKPLFSLGQLVWARGIRKAVDTFEPDAVIAIGLGKIFPAPALAKTNVPLGILLGDNSHTFLKMSFRQRLIQRFFKKAVYEKAIRNADRIFTYTPETESVLGNWLSAQSKTALANKNVAISLGFDHHNFFYSAEIRSQTRQQLGIAEDETLLISVARMGPNKNFTPLIQALENRVASGQKLKCLFVGVGEDAHSNQLRNQVAQSNCTNAFLLKSFQPHAELNALYNAADMGFWPITAISIFEGMGTGLVLLLPSDPSLSHLKNCPENAVFFESDLKAALGVAGQKVYSFPRTERVAMAVDKFAYKSLAQIIVESIQSG